MNENKQYFYLRLKENFFTDDRIVALESMIDGYLYCNILLKIYLKSLKHGGKLAIDGRIPYSPEMLTTITGHNVSTVKSAFKAFKYLGLVEILDDGIIYMEDIQQFIGSSSTEADRKRQYRQKIDREKELLKLKKEEKKNIKSAFLPEDKCPEDD